MKERIKKYKISDEIAVFCMPIEQKGSKRESERLAEKALLTHIFNKDTELKHKEDGRPYIETPNTDKNEIYLSISHSKSHLAIAISKNEIGIDIENISERLLRVKDKFLSEKEQDKISLTTENLCKCWCAKEAIYKIAGNRAGLMGENIEIFTDEIEGNGTFRAKLIRTNELYKLTVIEQNKDYIIVTAWAL